MADTLTRGGVSAIAVFIGGLALWPPRSVYWENVASVVGAGITLTIVLICAVILGALIVWKIEKRIRVFALGAVLAYVGWMIVIEATLNPESPVHFLWYGLILLCFLAGGILRTVYAGFSTLRIPSIGPN